MAGKGRHMTRAVEGLRMRRPTAAFVGMGLDFERDWITNIRGRWWAFRALRQTKNGIHKGKVFGWCVASLPEPEYGGRDRRARDLPEIELGEFRTVAGCARALNQWHTEHNPKTKWGVLGEPEKELPERKVTAIVSLDVPAGVPDSVLRAAMQTAVLDYLTGLPSQNLMQGTRVRSLKLARTTEDMPDAR